MDRTFNEAELAEIRRMFDFMCVGPDRRAQIIDAANYVLARGGTARVSLFGWCTDPNPGDYTSMRCSMEVFVGREWDLATRRYRPARGNKGPDFVRDVESMIVELTLGDMEGAAIPRGEDVDTLVQLGFRQARIFDPPYSWSSEPQTLRARMVIGRSKAQAEKIGTDYERGQESGGSSEAPVRAKKERAPKRKAPKVERFVAASPANELAEIAKSEPERGVPSALARVVSWPRATRATMPKVSTVAAVAMLRGPAALPMGAIAKERKSKRSTSTGPEADCARMLAAKRWGKPWPPKAANDVVATREPEVIDAEFVEAPSARVHESWMFRDYTGQSVERAVLIMGEALLDDPFRDRVGARKVEKHALDDTRARVSVWIGRKHLMLRSRVHDERHLVSVSLVDDANEVARRDVFYTLDRSKQSVLDEVVSAVQSLATPPSPQPKRTKNVSAIPSGIVRLNSWATVSSSPRMTTAAAVAMLAQPARALPMGSIAPVEEPAAELVVSHTLEEGTTITGNTRPWADAIKGLGMAFKWFAPKRLWFRQQSRGRAKPSVPLERVAEALRKRGATVRVEQSEAIDEAEANEFRAHLLRDRAERLEERAEKKASAASAKHAAVRGIADMIPFGQPILVGHHSEKRARKDADRIFNLTGQGIALQREAEHLANRARSTERRAEEALAHAEIVRNRGSIETFIEQFGALLKKGAKSQLGATSVQLFANNKGDVTWYVGFNGAAIPVFMDGVVLDKATRAIRVANRTAIDAAPMSAEEAFVAVRNELAKRNRVTVDPTMPAPDLRASQRGSSARSASEKAMLDGLTRAMSSPGTRLAMNVSYGKRTVRGKDRYRWGLQGGGTGLELIEVIVDLQRDGDGWIALVERADQPRITERIAFEVESDAKSVLSRVVRAVKTAMFRSGKSLREQIRAIESAELPAYVTTAIEDVPKLSEAQWKVRRAYTNATGWIDEARKWARVVNGSDQRWVEEWIELLGRLPSLLAVGRFDEFDAWLTALVAEWNEPSRAERRRQDFEDSRRWR
ncbi:MAG: DUF3560 domain-containing protein [Polyangiales bacterium]